MDRRPVMVKGIVLPAIRGVDPDVIGNPLRRHSTAAVRNILVCRAVREIIDVVRRDRHLCAVVHRRAVRCPYKLVVVRCSRRIDNVAACVVVDEFVIVARTRVDELRICIIVLVDRRILCEPQLQHTAINRALCRLGKFVRAAIHDDVVRVQAELVHHRVRRAIRRVRTGVLRPREIHNHRAAKVNPVPVQRHADVCDVVPHIIRRRRAIVLHGSRAVVDLRCVGRCEGKGRVVYIDRRLLYIALPVAVRIELIVPGSAAKGRIHRRPQPCVLHILVRPRIGIGGKARARTLAVVAYDIRRRARRGQIREFVGDGKPRHIMVQHCCFGSRNRRINRGIFRKTVIGFMLLAKGDIYLALCDRIPRLCDGRSNR